MIILDVIVKSSTLAPTLVCFVNVCVAAQMALTVICLIYFWGKEPVHVYVVSCKESCDFFEDFFYTGIQIRNSLAFVCLIHTCAIRLVIVCLFVCLPS